MAVKSDVRTGHDIAYLTRSHASGCAGAMAYYTRSGDLARCLRDEEAAGTPTRDLPGRKCPSTPEGAFAPRWVTNSVTTSQSEPPPSQGSTVVPLLTREKT
jgi:hypothetical protein